MILILAEKPSQARNFAAALGGMKGSFNGESYQITNARGHLYSFKDVSDQVSSGAKARYQKWALEGLPWDEGEFKWDYEFRKDASGRVTSTKALVKTIVDQAKSASEICIATDDDPTGEGQLLAAEILLENSLDKGRKITRMYFVDESEKEVQKAFKARKTIKNLRQDPDYMKALYRTKWDFLSMQFTRIATILSGGGVMLRQGRLKSAMVYLVGKQFQAIDEYKATPFYSNKFRDENDHIYTSSEEPVFANEKDVPQIYKPSQVVVDSETKKKSGPPRLIDLASLASRMASKGIGSKEVLALYQKMYEAQVVSYPRTEDKFITPEQFNELAPLVDKIAKVVGVDSAKLTHRSPRRTHVKEGAAHGANRPGIKVPASLSELDTKFGRGASKIYETLALSFLAMFAEDYEYLHQKGHVKDYPAFTATANIPLSKGWKAIFDSDEEEEDTSSKKLGTKAEPFIHKGVPPRPQTPTMAWLMKQLEKRDVGTGATRTSIYAEVTNQRSKGRAKPLLKDSRGKISMTEAGSMSYEMLHDTNIGDLGLTERLMEQMRRIAKGELDADQCLAEVKTLVEQDIETMRKNGMNLTKGGKFMTQATPRYQGEFNGEKISFKKIIFGYELSDDECEALLRGESLTIDAKSKAGKPYKMRGCLAKQKFENSDGKVIEFYGFKRDDFPMSWCGHTFTDAERKRLMIGGEVELTGLTSKAGKKFDTVICAKKGADGRYSIEFANTDKVPASWCGYKFSDEDKTVLEAGGKVHIQGAVSKKGNVFDCTVTFEEEEAGKGKRIKPHFD